MHRIHRSTKVTRSIFRKLRDGSLYWPLGITNIPPSLKINRSGRLAGYSSITGAPTVASVPGTTAVASSEVLTDALVIPGDPIIGDTDLPPGQGATYSYYLSGSSNPAGTNNLIWTFPALNYTDFVPKKLYLQRAASSDYNYEGVARSGHEGQFIFIYERDGELATSGLHNGGPDGSAGSADVGWTTIQTWNAPASINDWPTGAQDAPGTTATYLYRLIAIFEGSWQSGTDRVEIDWNTIIVIQRPVIQAAIVSGAVQLTITLPTIT